MKLKDFINSKEDCFMNNNGYTLTKKEIIKEIRKRVEHFVAHDSDYQEIKDTAVQWVLEQYEPYTDETVSKVEKIMEKLGLYEKEIHN